MRWLILCSLMAVAPLPGGCHLLFPFNVDAPPATDGAPADTTWVEARPPADLVEHDGPIKHDGASPPSWTTMIAKGLTSADTSSALKIWGLSATEIYIGVGSDVYLCSDADLKTTELTCTKLGSIGGGTATITGMGGASPEVFAVSNQGLVLSKTTSWSTLISSTIDHFTGIFCRDKTTCIPVGARDVGPATFQIVYDISSGSLATPYTNQFAPKFNAVWSTANTTAVACDACTIYMKAPKIIWAPQKPGGVCSKNLLGIWGSGDTDIHAVGEGGIRLRWNGTQLMNVGSGGNDLNAIWGHGSTYFAVGNGGAIRIRRGGGWGGEEIHPGGDLTGVWGLSADHVYAVGRGNRVLRYH